MSISLTDPAVTIAGIKQFGLAPDGSDLRDLAAAFERLRAASATLATENERLRAALAKITKTPSDDWQFRNGHVYRTHVLIAEDALESLRLGAH